MKDAWAIDPSPDGAILPQTLHDSRYANNWRLTPSYSIACDTDDA